MNEIDSQERTLATLKAQKHALDNYELNRRRNAAKLIDSKRRVFLSHASADIPLASHLEDVIRASVPDVEVFRTSRPGQLKSGTGWFSEIERQLREADAFVVLITPQSHDRWWVHFEAGAALQSGRTFIPVLAGKLEPKDVNEPIRYLTLRRLQSADDAREALRELGGELRNPDEFVKQIIALAATSAANALQNSEWEMIEINGAVYAWSGPLSQLPLEAPVEEPAALQGTLESQGQQITHGFLEHLIEGAQGFAPVFFIDSWRAKHYVMNPQRQILWTKRRK